MEQFEKEEQAKLNRAKQEKTAAWIIELLPVKRTVKKYKFSLVDSHCSVGLFYAAIYILCFSIGVKMPRLR